MVAMHVLILVNPPSKLPANTAEFRLGRPYSNDNISVRCEPVCTIDSSSDRSLVVAIRRYAVLKMVAQYDDSLVTPR